MTMTSGVVDKQQREAKAALLGSICSIRLGYRGTIHRWKPRATLKYSVDCQSFPEASYAMHAANALDTAASLWNEGNVGVRFEKVADNEPATFQLVYGDQLKGDGTAANAFLPSEVMERQPRLTVYPLAFTDGYDYLANIFCHELGHVLGLRHEFKEPLDRSVRWGKKNASSVMNYLDHPSEYSIHCTDYNDVRRFYAYEGAQYKGFRVVDVEPVYFTPASQ